MSVDEYSLCAHAIEVDLALREVGRQILLIPALHPRNTAEEKERFFRRGGGYIPSFEYRPLNYDPRDLRHRVRELFQRSGKIRSRWLRSIFRAKCRELDLKLALVESRGTPQILPLSMRLYPKPSLRMVHDAEVLASLPRLEEERHLS